MTRRTRSRSVRYVVAVTAAIGALAGLGAPASGGGWAIGALDSIPEPQAGETIDVGFTILQHGVTPVSIAEDVGIEIVRADGAVDYFASTSDGATGHYTAAVTFPETAGDYAWRIRMGWFGPQDLGTVQVTSADGGAITGASVWPTARWVTLALSVALALVAAGDRVVRRRPARAALS